MVRLEIGRILQAYIGPERARSNEVLHFVQVFMSMPAIGGQLFIHRHDTLSRRVDAAAGKIAGVKVLELKAPNKPSLKFNIKLSNLPISIVLFPS
ncbi:hypothetical protein [[Eubacterium] cellulosolvens]